MCLNLKFDNIFKRYKFGFDTVKILKFIINRYCDNEDRNEIMIDCVKKYIISKNEYQDSKIKYNIFTNCLRIFNVNK